MKKIFAILGVGVCLFTQAYGLEGNKSFKTKMYLHKYAKGLKRDLKSKSKMQAILHHSYVTADAMIPGSFDFSKSVSLPENQGNCGSCWDFALTKALRSEYMLAGRDPGVLDFNYLLNNCGPGPRMDGCNGGDFPAAASFEQGKGPGLNSQDPYTQKEGSCKNLAVKATTVSYSMLGTSSSGPTFKDVAYALSVLNHMLVIDVAAGQGEWENYSDGIYNDCQGNSNDIDHMVNLVGYSCETSVDSQGNCLFDPEGKPVHKDGYLIVENNWGESWGTQAANGHGGYMKTRMYDSSGNKCNAVATDALMFQTNLPAPSPTPSPTPIPHPSCTGFLCGGVLGCWMPWCHS